MADRTESRITIQAPAAAVLDVIADFDSYPEWTGAVKQTETLVTDGPYTEVKEALGGYFLYEADDLDAAIELAARVPAARMGGAVEVRPVAEW